MSKSIRIDFSLTVELDPIPGAWHTEVYQTRSNKEHWEKAVKTIVEGVSEQYGGSCFIIQSYDLDENGYAIEK